MSVGIQAFVLLNQLILKKNIQYSQIAEGRPGCRKWSTQIIAIQCSAGNKFLINRQKVIRRRMIKSDKVRRLARADQLAGRTPLKLFSNKVLVVIIYVNSLRNLKEKRYIHSLYTKHRRPRSWKRSSEIIAS